MPAGRPSEFTEAKGDAICLALAEGLSLRKITAAADMPDRVTVLRWLAQNEGFRIQYALARESFADHMADEILEIADDGTNDTLVDEKGNETVDYDHIQRSKLRVDTRKWLLARMSPRKYGDRVLNEHTGDGGGPLKIEIGKDDAKL